MCKKRSLLLALIIIIILIVLASIRGHQKGKKHESDIEYCNLRSVHLQKRNNIHTMLQPDMIQDDLPGFKRITNQSSGEDGYASTIVFFDEQGRLWNAVINGDNTFTIWNSYTAPFISPNIIYINSKYEACSASIIDLDGMCFFQNSCTDDLLSGITYISGDNQIYTSYCYS